MSEKRAQQVFMESSIFQKIGKMADLTGGRIGVAAQEIESGLNVTINGDEMFVMASTFKVAIAMSLLDLVDKGQLRLNDLIDIPLTSMVIGDACIGKIFIHPGVKLSIANLIETMITKSDNTATDICLEISGGPKAVTEKLRSMGITGQRIDRSCSEIIKDFFGLPDKGYISVVKKALIKDPDLFKEKPDQTYELGKDPRDQSTPSAMLELLLSLDNGTALSTKSRKFLLASMSRTSTGDTRLRGLLPEGTPVSNKTGTIGNIVNDVGFITLPDSRRFAVVIFTERSKTSETTETDSERVIAEIARALYDFYCLP